MATDTSAVMPPPERAKVQRVQQIVKVVLRSGLVVSVVFMVAGLVMKVVSGSRRSHPTDLFELSAGSSADAVMAIGVLLLALTPAASIVTLAVMWARHRDWRFAGIAAAVVTVLVASLVISHH